MLMRIYIQISVLGSYEPNISTVQYSTVLNKSNDPLTSQYFITCFNKIKNKYMNRSGSKKNLDQSWCYWSYGILIRMTLQVSFKPVILPMFLITLLGLSCEEFFFGGKFFNQSLSFFSSVKNLILSWAYTVYYPENDIF